MLSLLDTLTRDTPLHYTGLLELPENTQGRDFVVGDIHGARDLVEKKLEGVGFSPSSGDRLIATGDLVDRGPDSLGVLKWLLEPWFHATLGNHERMLLAYLGQPETRAMASYRMLGFSGWVENLSAPDRRFMVDELVPHIRAMPLVIRVDATIPWYVVHAGRYYQHGILDDQALAKKMEETPGTRLVAALTWQRTVAAKALVAATKTRTIKAGSASVLLTHQPWDFGTSATFVGHTIVPQPILYRSHLFIDRGACRRRSEQSPWDVGMLEPASLWADLGLSPRSLD